uniref:MHC class I-like antigen recognition-like domain-containing protein n=1 Tax=Poecilia formosa TaxID=48698 RepID=A0A096MCV4_POEFO
RWFLLTLIFCLLSSAEKHFLKFYQIGSSGLPHVSQVEIVAEVDGSLVGYCNRTDIRITHDWAKKFLDDDVELLTLFKMKCFHQLPNIFQTKISDLKQRLKQPEGVYIVQWIDFCSWDTETGELTGSIMNYNGEDFLALDIERDSWIPLKQQAIPIKLAWDNDKDRIHHNRIFISQMCPDWLKRSLDYGRNFLMRTGNMTRSSFNLYHRITLSLCSFTLGSFWVRWIFAQPKHEQTFLTYFLHSEYENIKL